MYLQGSLDLLWCHQLAFAVFAIDTDAFSLFRHHQVAFTIHAVDCLLVWATRHIHLVCYGSVLLDLLLRVPEPFVDLIDFQVQLLCYLIDLLPGRSLTTELFIKFPELIFLALRLPCPIRLLFLRRESALPF